MKCPKCQSDNTDSARFCSNCATPLGSAREAVVSKTMTIQDAPKVLAKGTTYAGKYKILERLGRGGMGIVYKAEDTKLKRTVALKFLPDELSKDRHALERFEREAQAASALNHPNICVIHDIDEADGQPFIAMEYIAGKTLDDLIGHKGLKLIDALAFAIQITDALAKAQTAGIIHRDLKPPNIMVTEDGLVKILDFGLAKLTESFTSGGEGAPATTSSTERPQTEEGVIVGTVAYMSPEQAEGRKVDARSDIFSFGSVFYEMLTGQRAFRGESKISTLSAILHKDPKPVSEIAAAVPIEVERILDRCLRKDPQRRWQTMSDLKIALQDVKEESESAKLASVEPRGAGKLRWLWIVTAGVAIVAAAVAIALLKNRRPPSAIELKAERLTFNPGITDTPAISSDGKLIAYASDRSGEGNLDIYVQYASGGQPSRLTRHEADDFEPAFSPDGSQIVFRSERDGGGLYIIETLGGTPEKKLVSGGRSPSFSPDGSTVAYVDDRSTGFPPAQKIHLISAKGGPPRPFQPAFGVVAYLIRPTLTWSADGKYLAFSGVRAGNPPVSDWWIAPLDGSPPVAAGEASIKIPRIPIRELAGVYGKHLYFVRGSMVEGIHLFRTPLAPGTWKITGPVQQLTSGGGIHLNFSIASNGQMVFSILNMAQDFASLPLPPKGSPASQPPTKITSDATNKGGLSISRDGSVVAYVAYVSWQTGRIEIRIHNVATGGETVYASERLPNTANPQISPDGSMLAYEEEAGGKFVSFVGSPENLPGRQICENGQVLSFFSNSKDVLIRYGVNRLVRQNVSTGAQTELLNISSGGVLDARVSPDDRWFTFVLAAPDRPIETYIAPVGLAPAMAETWLRVSTGCSYDNCLGLISRNTQTTRSFSPVWDAEGDLLYYISNRDGYNCIWAQRLDHQTKHPQGQPYALYHMHRTETSGMSFGGGQRMFLAGARDKLIIPVWTVTGNLWTAKVDVQK